MFDLSIRSPDTMIKAMGDSDIALDFGQINNPNKMNQDYMTLFGTNYVYRIQTTSMFEEEKEHIFDVFIVQNDIKLAEYNLFKNFWKETLMLSQIDDVRAPAVLSFG